MSGIFKGDSIYKSGGGGGGYKDGGQLVDDDFIKVDNNTISSYENESRDVINFYFEPKQGEILNSVIQVTTQVNATVNVYYLNENNIFVLLSYIGSNTVNAGDQYSVNVTGNSYEVEEETPPNPDPNEYITLLYGKAANFKKIGDYYWMTENFNGIIPGVDYKTGNGTVYYKLADLYAKNNNFENGYILPNSNTVQNLYSALGRNSSNAGAVLKDSVGWNNANPLYVGDNSAGMNFKGKGCYFNTNFERVGDLGMWAYRSDLGAVQGFTLYDTSFLINNENWGNKNKTYFTVRFIKPV